MQKINVNLAEKSYEIVIGGELLADAGQVLAGLGLGGRVVVVTSPNISDLYGERLSASLAKVGFTASTLLVPEGEAYKNLETASSLYREITAAGAERRTPILALGGGVIGDLAGFVAATYQRGVPLVQIPTTLLAQVDSSIGGKTAVDLGELKNMVGVFYQPIVVISDVSTLETLPDDEFAGGLAEVIKTAAIRDARLFTRLEKNIERILQRDKPVLEEIIGRTAAIKVAVVAEDEKDLGIRNILNYGHTIGHAIEAASGFGLKHGAAVAIGMVAAANISQRLGGLAPDDVSRLENLLVRAGLPVMVPELPVAEVLSAMGHDKKKAQGKQRFVLLKGIGNCYVSDAVSADMVKEVLENGRA
ncbi:3-dehydroquinate synthase [Chloroflexota bacterium]